MDHSEYGTKNLSEPLLLANNLNHTQSVSSRTRNSKWRQWLYSRIVSTKWFQIYILITILLNLCLIIIDSISPSSFLAAHIVSQCIFTLEMGIKMAAFGLVDRIHPQQIPFLRHPYHLFDCFVVFISWITLFQFNMSCTALRVIFILFFIPSLEMAVHTLSMLRSLKYIFRVFMFFMLVLMICALSGTYLLSGCLHQRCYAVPSPSNSTDTISSSNLLCHDDSDCIAAGHGLTECLSTETNPQHGLSSFDNVLMASFQIFTAFTRHWALSMSHTVQCFGHWSISIYWIFMTFVFLFIVSPLMLSFMADAFNDAHLAKNRLYLKRTNTVWTGCTANVIFYKFTYALLDMPFCGVFGAMF